MDQRILDFDHHVDLRVLCKNNCCINSIRFDWKLLFRDSLQRVCYTTILGRRGDHNLKNGGPEFFDQFILRLVGFLIIKSLPTLIFWRVHSEGQPDTRQVPRKPKNEPAKDFFCKKEFLRKLLMLDLNHDVDPQLSYRYDFCADGKLTFLALHRRKNRVVARIIGQPRA